MTISQARGAAAETNEEEQVAGYLQRTPDFFERHQPLLAKLKLPHARSGSTISLVERQVEVLRDQRAAADSKLAEFVRVARANDALADRIHRFTRRMMRAGNRATVVTELEASLREDFDAFQSVLVLVEGAVPEVSPRGERFLRYVSGDDANFRSFDALFQSGKPRCGQVRDTQRDWLFASDAAEIGSVALVPLGVTKDHPTPIGLLALGSNERERFHPGMATEFLGRMGELIADALARA